MRIATNTVSEGLVRQMQLLGSKQSKLQTQVATGQRIFNPDDDPNAVGRVLNLESQQRQLQQYVRNADRAMELSQISFSGLRAIKTVGDRATEIGTLVRSPIIGDAAGAYSSELNQLIEQAVLAANTKFGNEYVFAGTAVDQPPFTVTRDLAGKVTAVAYAGNAANASIDVSENSSIVATTSGTTNTGIRDFINQLVALRDAVATSDTAGIETAQTALLASEDVLVSALAEQGGIQLRIEATQTQLLQRSDSIEGMVSDETDVDLSESILRLNQTQTAYQAALQSAANIMRISLLDYIN